MKYLLWKILSIVTLMVITSASTAQEHDVFSHAVLRLPHDLKSEEPWTRVINTQEEWQLFYDELFAENEMPPVSLPAPLLDFENYLLLAGGLGIRSSGGFTVSVESVHEFENEIFIQVLEILPGVHCVVTAAITYPSAAILIKKTNKPFKSSVLKATHDCPGFGFGVDYDK